MVHSLLRVGEVAGAKVLLWVGRCLLSSKLSFQRLTVPGRSAAQGRQIARWVAQGWKERCPLTSFPTAYITGELQGGTRMVRKRCGACLTGWDLMGWVGQKEVKGSLTGVSRVELESHGCLTG